MNPGPSVSLLTTMSLSLVLLYLVLLIQRTDVINKVENFRNKTFFIAHGTADGKRISHTIMHSLTHGYSRLCHQWESHSMHASRQPEEPISYDAKRSTKRLKTCTSESVALVARQINNRKVVGSRPTKVVRITVLTGNRLG